MAKKRTLYLSIAELKQLGLIKKHLKRKRKRYQKRLVTGSNIPSQYNGIKSSSDMQSFGQQINRANDLDNIIKQNFIEKQEKQKREVIDLTQDDDYTTPMKNGYDEKKSFSINRTPTKNGYDFGDSIDVSETKGSDYFPTEGTSTPEVILEETYPNNTDTNYIKKLLQNKILNMNKVNQDPNITVESPNTYQSEMASEFDKLKTEYLELKGTKDISKWNPNNRNIALLYNLIDTLEGNISGARKAKSSYQIPKKANAI